MIKTIVKVFSDFWGLHIVCGWTIALKWGAEVILKFNAVLRSKNLQPVDLSLGTGPFLVTLRQYKNAQFRICGPNAISGIREMYVRDVYLRGGWLKIPTNGVVLDLGANMGNFTNMALAASPDIRVVAVEPSKALNKVFVNSVGLNPGFLSRTNLIRAFLGKSNPKIDGAIAADDNYKGVPWISEKELLKNIPIQSVEFLKCDIEGGEFSLLSSNSLLLKITRQIACEVHAMAGSVENFLSNIAASGFMLGPVQRDPDGTVTFLAKRL